MSGSSLLAYAHYTTIAALFALLILEHHSFKPALSARQAKRLIVLDLSYGLMAALVFSTGAARVIWFGKGWQYYLTNSVFLSKVGLFLLISLLSMLPTFTFLNWRPQLVAQQAPSINPRQRQWVLWTMRVEFALLLGMLALAHLLARGYGQ